MALPTQPEEYLDHVRSVRSRGPSLEEELEEILQLSILKEAAGDYTADAYTIKENIIKRRRRALLITFSAMIFVSVSNKVFQKLETVPMYNYPGFLNVYTTFVYIPLSFGYIIPMIYFGSAITPQQRSVPKSVFAVIGLLDGLGGITQLLAATYISGPLVILLSQSAIPISMVISKRLLKSKYSISQYLGALCVAIGILIVLTPALSSGNAGGGVGWCFAMIVSCIPIALSSVYKEIALGETELDPVYLNGWVALFQLFVCIPLLLPAGLVSSPPVMPNQLIENFVDGFKCYIGINSITDGPHADDCWPDGPLYVNLYILFNAAYNILLILLLKYGSANLLFMAMTMTVPLGNVAFALPFMPSSTPLKVTDLWGLLVIMTGLVLYRFGTKLIPCITRSTTERNDQDDERRKPLLDISENHVNFEGGRMKKVVAFSENFLEHPYEESGSYEGGEENNPFFDTASRNGKNSGKPLEYEM